MLDCARMRVGQRCSISLGTGYADSKITILHMKITTCRISSNSHWSNIVAVAQVLGRIAQRCFAQAGLLNLAGIGLLQA